MNRKACRFWRGARAGCTSAYSSNAKQLSTVRSKMLQRAKVIARVAEQAGILPERLQDAFKPTATAIQRSVPSWVFLGPPGVGKGTYASRVADALGIAHISAGDLVRTVMKEDTELGRKVRWEYTPCYHSLKALDRKMEAGYYRPSRASWVARCHLSNVVCMAKAVTVSFCNVGK
jgi:hypothetical protein